MGFTKLFSDIICSSIWNEDDKTRIVWITLLAIKGPNHVARATVGALAHQARVSVEDCRNAIEKLCSPDPDGLDQPYEGRRMQPVEHGWFILNGEAYRLRRDEDDRKQYLAQYMRDYRRKQNVNNRKQSVSAVNIVNPSDQIRSEADQKEEKSIVASATKPKRFKSRPSGYEELKTHVLEKLGLEENDAAWLWEKWMGNGFRVNGKVMDSWKHTAACWERQHYFPSQKPQQPAFGFR